MTKIKGINPECAGGTSPVFSPPKRTLNDHWVIAVEAGNHTEADLLQKLMAKHGRDTPIRELKKHHPMLTKGILFNELQQWAETLKAGVTPAVPFTGDLQSMTAEAARVSSEACHSVMIEILAKLEGAT